MADLQKPGDKSRSPVKTKRSQKIIQLSPSDTKPPDIPEDSVPSREYAPPTRSHTPGHLSTKSVDRRKKDVRQRSHSHSLAKTSQSPAPVPASKPPAQLTQANGAEGSKSAEKSEEPILPLSAAPAAGKDEQRRPLALRATSAIASKPPTSSTTTIQTPKLTASASRAPRGPQTFFPPLPDPKTAPDVAPAPASGMYWSKAPTSGASHTALRAHTTTLIGSNIYVFGGCDSRSCFNELYVFDADAFYWSCPHVVGEIPTPLRAMTCTAVGKKLVVFGGGDGPTYSNDVYILDTVNFRWSKPKLSGTLPSRRRAHASCLYRNGIYMFGGGDGIRALNDVWRLDVADINKLSWRLISAPTDIDDKDQKMAETRPKARGYHTANIVGSKLIIFGGSDGGECFRDVWVFDIETQTWNAVDIAVSYPRLSHTATIVGSYLFVIGGHDGVEYSNEVLLLNLVTMQWDKRKIYGQPPSGRGYHGTVLHDSRLYAVGGFDGITVFGDVHILELAMHAYYSQISHFTIEV